MRDFKYLRDTSGFNQNKKYEAFEKAYEAFLLEDFDFLNKERKYNDLFHYIQDGENYNDEQLLALYIRLRDKSNTLKSKKINILDVNTWPEAIKSRIDVVKPATKQGDPIDADAGIYRTIPDEEAKAKFKNVKFNKKGYPIIKHLIGKKIPSYENIVDLMDDMDLVERTNKFIKLLPNKAETGQLRSKVKDRQEEFAEILVNYTDYDDYKNNFLKKANMYHNVRDFFSALKTHVNSFKPKDRIVQNIRNNPNTDIVMFERDILIAVIYNYDASCEVGSRQWCISTGSGMWRSYVESEGNVQYFVWDFNEPNTSNKSQVGITVRNEGGIRAAHLKNDAGGSSYVKQQWWASRLVGFKDLGEMSQIKYAVSNPEIERMYKIISKMPSEKRNGI